ncbi:hypothetical protein HYH03_011821 [Edaphochlamys debaryana]|uniref:Uncharacterized protein n=1 Tax=Edaphochlamys debaryana TaxID=47281 RepID=A0A836BW44_9CHLO|nr:hypothetical protein HYH03_011821 [Edaphochlamys debaryana]|eukprot:KAG2489714.1 hypothetical protein HYH03_011821 [Edaphochlamys debaryana]
MDLLGNYSDSDDEDQAGEQKPAPGPSSMPAVKLRNTAPDPDAEPEQKPTGLFNPFADDDAGASAYGAGPSGSGPGSGSKRGVAQVTGSGLVRQPGPAKASRSSPAGPTAAGPKPAFNTALLPPQLRGRANVSTEDVEKMFTKGTLAARKAAAAAAEGRKEAAER